MWRRRLVGLFVLVLVLQLTMMVPLGLSTAVEAYTFYTPKVQEPLQLYPAAPSELKVTGTTDSSVTLSWTHSGSATGFNIYYSTSLASNKLPANPVKKSTTSSPVTVSGLKAGTKYYFVVKAYNSFGESVASNLVNATTSSSTVLTPVVPKLDDDVLIDTTPTVPDVINPFPAAPANVKVTGTTDSSVTLSWTHSGSADGFNVYYSTSLTSQSLPANPRKKSTSRTRITITGLSAGTKYYFVVKAYNSFGESSASNLVSAKTSGGFFTPKVDLSDFFEVPFGGVKEPAGDETGGISKKEMLDLTFNLGSVLPATTPQPDSGGTTPFIPSVASEIGDFVKVLGDTTIGGTGESPSETPIFTPFITEAGLNARFAEAVLDPSGEILVATPAEGQAGEPATPGPQLLLAFAADNGENPGLSVGDVLFLVFDNITNKPEIDPRSLSQAFPLSGGSWGTGTKELIWLDPVPDQGIEGNTLAIVFTDPSGADLVPETTMVEVAAASGITGTEGAAGGGSQVVSGSFGPPAQGPPPPQLIGAQAFDLQAEGDAVLLIFDSVTNRPEISPRRLPSYFPVTGGNWGTRGVECQWFPPEEGADYGDILAVVFGPESGVELVPGETTIGVTEESEIADPSGQSAVIEGNPVLLVGDFGVEQATAAGPLLIGAVARDLGADGKAVLLVFDRTTNKPEIEADELPAVFPVTGGSWGQGQKELAWFEPEDEEEYGDVLAVLFGDTSGVDLIVGESSIGVAEGSGITDTTGQGEAYAEAPLPLTGDFGAEQPSQQGQGEISFTDTAGHWARDNINKLVQRGITNGYPGNLFKPQKTLTRAEFMTFIVRSLYAVYVLSQNNWEVDGQMETFVADPAPTPYFTDTAGHWSSGYLALCEELGIIDPSEYENGRFEPDREITRLEIAVAVARAMGLEESGAGPLDFTDADLIPADKRWYVAAATQQGIITGYPEGNFGPMNKASRAEAATMLVRMLGRFGDPLAQ